MSLLTAGRVDVLGAIALDTQLLVDRLPEPSEVISATRTITGLGGRGANQAVAIARSGVDARLFASIGDDEAGSLVREELASFGVDTELVTVHPGETTGHGYTFVSADHSYRTVVVQGANLHTDAAAIRELADRFATAAVVLVQGEIGFRAVEETLHLAEQWTGRLVLNPGPLVDIDHELLRRPDVLVLNGREAALLVGAEPTQDVAAIEEMAVELSGLGTSVVVSVGSEGAVVAPYRRPVEFVLARTAEVVDRAGAGDAFVGLLAAGIARGLGVQEAAETAVREATRTVSRRGAVRSYPTFDWQ